jgi:hypothetical protein
VGSPKRQGHWLVLGAILVVLLVAIVAVAISS